VHQHHVHLRKVAMLSSRSDSSAGSTSHHSNTASKLANTGLQQPLFAETVPPPRPPRPPARQSVTTALQLPCRGDDSLIEQLRAELLAPVRHIAPPTVLVDEDDRRRVAEWAYAVSV
jgi:hypothetical protein